MVHFYSNISTIEEAVKVGICLENYWFRGHSETYGELVPGAFRKNNLGIFNSSKETTFTEEFKRQAPAFSDFIPEEINHLEWLFIMQHYGCPTRLLDWSQNILVALYFIVKSNFKKDGELWIIEPEILNEISKRDFKIANTSDPYVKQLASQAFLRNDEESFTDNLVIKHPVALFPPMRFPRMINQSSVFTIHPFPDKEFDVEYDSLSAALGGGEFIFKYKIPSICKKKLLSNLSALGINEHTLFPNLDSLSKSIKLNSARKKQVLKEPNPPKFDEP